MEPTGPPRHYRFDDLQVGQRFVGHTSRVVTEADIIGFGREFDPHPAHIDPAIAAQSLFGGLVASGWHTAAVAVRLLVEGAAPFTLDRAGLGAQLSWPKPTRPGDTLRVTSEIVGLRASRSRPGCGIVTLRVDTWNQRDEIVLVLNVSVLLNRES